MSKLFSLEDIKKAYDENTYGVSNSYRYVVCTLPSMLPLELCLTFDDLKSELERARNNSCQAMIGVDLLTMERISF